MLASFKELPRLRTMVIDEERKFEVERTKLTSSTNSPHETRARF